MRGFTVLEALVGLLLTWLIAGVALTTLSVQRRAQGALTQRAEVLATVRTARHLLGREARAAGPGEGGWVVTGDSLALRAFRGHGTVCPTRTAPDELLVAPRGWRQARPEDDSVWVVYPDAPPQVRFLLRVQGWAGPCAAVGEEAWERWTFSAPLPPGGVFVRYFQSSSYHLIDGALRYRTGRGGRQPLTPDVLDADGSGFQPDGAGVEVHLVPRGEPGRVWTVRMGGHAGPPPGESGGGG